MSGQFWNQNKNIRNASMDPETRTYGGASSPKSFLASHQDHDELWNCRLVSMNIPLDYSYPQDDCEDNKNPKSGFETPASFTRSESYNASVAKSTQESTLQDALKAFNARPTASRTRLIHDSQQHHTTPTFYFTPTLTMTLPAEIITQREIVDNIVGRADALRNHKFKVDLSYKSMFPMNVFDTIETNRYITEDIYSSLWSDIIDAECAKHPMECAMNDVTRMINFEIQRKEHLKHVEKEVWQLYKLTMDLHPDTQSLILICTDTETLIRALMNPVLRTNKEKTSLVKAHHVKPRTSTTHAKGRIAFDS